RREQGPQGRIGFAISVRMSEALREAILEVPEKEWKGYGEPEPGIDRECAEVCSCRTSKPSRRTANRRATSPSGCANGRDCCLLRGVGAGSWRSWATSAFWD